MPVVRACKQGQYPTTILHLHHRLPARLHSQQEGRWALLYNTCNRPSIECGVEKAVAIALYPPDGYKQRPWCNLTGISRDMAYWAPQSTSHKMERETSE
jgi:hypothetical protein